jgi:hypothetical protein
MSLASRPYSLRSVKSIASGSDRRPPDPHATMWAPRPPPYCRLETNECTGRAATQCERFAQAGHSAWEAAELPVVTMRAMPELLELMEITLPSGPL